MTDYTELAKRISEFSDGGARLWDYSPSHDRLVVRLQSKDRSRTAYLVFIGVQRMSIPTFWTPCSGRSESDPGRRPESDPPREPRYYPFFARRTRASTGVVVGVEGGAGAGMEVARLRMR